MMTIDLKDEYQLVLNSFYDKNLFHIYHGSLSVRTDNDKFLINRSDKLFNENNPSIELHYYKDVSWKDASADTYIHSRIYKEFTDIKCIANIFPENLISYSLFHKKFKPTDFIGTTFFEQLKIIEIEYESWEEQADTVIINELKDSDVVIIKGTSIFIVDRDLRNLAKKASILEFSAKILLKTKDL